MSIYTPAVRPLADNELPASVWAEKPWGGVSSKYTFVSTSEVVKALAVEGIRPYLAKSSRTRNESKWGYTKHMLRFRQDGAEPLPGGVYPEIIIINSHDTGSSYIGELGLYRLICKNGMVANYGTFAKYRGVHMGLSLENVIAGVFGIMAQFPRVADSVKAMQAHTLDASQRIAFAEQAARLRWNSDKLPIEPTVLLTTRREEDIDPTVWNVFNTVQENLITGQSIRTYGPSFSGYRRVTRSTRAIGSIDADLKINTGLWELASSFAGV
jgi:hypothetical protein